MLRVFSKNIVKKCLVMVEALAQKKDDYFRFRSGDELVSLRSTSATK